MTEQALACLFEPIRIGGMAAPSRVMHSPHAGAIGNLFGSERAATRNIAATSLAVATRGNRCGRFGGSSLRRGSFDSRPSAR